MSGAIRVGVAGVGGRMGRRVVRLAPEFPGLDVVAGLGPAGTFSADDVDEINVYSDPVEAIETIDVMIDFTAPPACAELAPLCAAAGVAYLCASTALSDSHRHALREASADVAVLEAANLSVGINVTAELVRRAARALPDFDVEVFELHHRHKRDSPSGTAFVLGEATRSSRPLLRDEVQRSNAPGPREADTIGYAALRGGDVPGEHTVFLLGSGERIEITHRSNTADVFARGALRAAGWLGLQSAGYYAMRDMLGG